MESYSVFFREIRKKEIEKGANVQKDADMAMSSKIRSSMILSWQNALSQSTYYVSRCSSRCWIRVTRGLEMKLGPIKFCRSSSGRLENVTSWEFHVLLCKYKTTKLR